jgi:hypothetical protein
MDPCSDSDADTDLAWEIDSESENQAENDPDYQEDWAGLPKPRTYAERMERNAEKRARLSRGVPRNASAPISFSDSASTKMSRVSSRM